MSNAIDTRSGVAHAIPLNAQDRCDRCGAQAQYVTIHDNGILMWCAHHANEHAAALFGEVKR